MIEGVTVLVFFQETYLVSMGRVKKGRSRMQKIRELSQSVVPEKARGIRDQHL